MKIGKSHSKESRKNMKIAQNARFLREPDWTKPFTIGELRTWGAEAKKECRNVKVVEKKKNYMPII